MHTVSSYRKRYNEWLNLDKDTEWELKQIKEEKEIQDRFYQELSFGTGGLRGLMGAGTNRMNKYTVKKASYALGSLLLNMSVHPSIVIAYDTRNNSYEFANDAADVFTSLGIKTYIFNECMPTPILSYAVRHLACDAGIVITASHNPKEYNGYKVYNSKGGQLVPSEAEKVMHYFSTFSDFDKLKELKVNSDLLEVLDDTLMDQFLAEIPQTEYPSGTLNVVYSPLHGAGNKPIKKILQSFDLTIVKEQELPDGNFSTVKLPNPENWEALKLAIQQARAVDADIVLATDPDCDRLGVAVKHNHSYHNLTGNQLGALFVDYLTKKSASNKQTIIKTIVTSELGTSIAKNRGFNTLDTLTGFKYIGEKINHFEDENQYLFGYEESYGYLYGTHTRDKDAVSSAWLICEMASYYQTKGWTLVDRLEHLYEEYGYYLDELDSITMEGKEGLEQIKLIMDRARQEGVRLVDNLEEIKDYSKGIEGLPKENVLKFVFKDNSWFAMRPSGTEPKLKIYYSIKGNSSVEAHKRLTKIKNILEEKLTIPLVNG